jgi:Holliday junction resolvasome RuvABC endonuclease subunit
MNNIQPNYPRILAIAPSTHGFGFALFEGQNILANWGNVRAETKDKNAWCIAKVKEMIARYQPGMMIFEDHSGKDSRRSTRIRTLSRQIIALASRSEISVILFSLQQVHQVFFENGEGTKHALAEIVAKRFPDELGFRLPPKRKPWKSEDARMYIFDAVALYLTFQSERKKVR